MDEINQEVQRHILENFAVVEAPKKKNIDYPLIVLFIVALIISATTCYSIWIKGSTHQLPQVTNSPQPVVELNTIQPVVEPPIVTSNDRLEALERRVDTLAQRQWLLGLVFNEHSVISNMAIKGTNPELAKKYILLDEQWNLSKTPEYLRMSDKDRQLIINYIK